MKKAVLILMLLVTLVLTACTADQGGILSTSKENTEQKWTYSLVTYQCVYDNDTNGIICVDPATKDETLLSNVIGSKAAQGFELDEILVAPKGKSNVQTFIFRKEYVEPEPAATEAE